MNLEKINIKTQSSSDYELVKNKKISFFSQIAYEPKFNNNSDGRVNKKNKNFKNIENYFFFKWPRVKMVREIDEVKKKNKFSSKKNKKIKNKKNLIKKKIKSLFFKKIFVHINDKINKIIKQ